MLYFTQLIFIKANREQEFNLFESYVLPLLSRHNGTLIYRVRPTEGCVIESTIEHPYEVHIITFPTKADFEAYRDDKDRLKHMHLKENAIEKALLIEGSLV
jgi:hypothetical protein